MALPRGIEGSIESFSVEGLSVPKERANESRLTSRKFYRKFRRWLSHHFSIAVLASRPE